MTRQGLCYPRAFYGTFRRAAERLHGRPLSEWLVDRFASTKGHPASEFEALGAFAYYRGGRDQFAWPAVTQNAASLFPALQKLSWVVSIRRCASSLARHRGCVDAGELRAPV